jgi:predicted nucleic acid-binding protein
MRYLLDTGILVRLPHRADPLHDVVRQALRNLALGQHQFVTTRQNMAEFWNVCTRPASARGGFGLSVNVVERRLRLLERFILVLNEPPTAYSKWKKLVAQYAVVGKQVHDARIAALMIAQKVKRVLTLNPADFQRFAEIEPVTPSAVIAR